MAETPQPPAVETQEEEVTRENDSPLFKGPPPTTSPKVDLMVRVLLLRLLIPSRAHSFSLTQAMLNSMAATAQVTAEKATASTEELEKKTTKQRRKSRELEDEVFGMSLNDVDKLQKVFNEIDSDGNGYIDTNELKSALQKAGQNPTDEQCKAVLAKFAKELGADKGVLFGEFQKMVAQWDSIEWDK